VFTSSGELSCVPVRASGDVSQQRRAPVVVFASSGVRR